MSRRILVTGTDTGVGKSVASLCIMKYCYQNNLKPCYIKPFQTGCTHPKDRDSDAWFVYKNIKELKNSDPNNSMIYCYNRPLAPYFSARHDNKLGEVSKTYINNYINQVEEDCNITIIEGAGGVLVPVTQNRLLIDYFEDFNLEVLIVARAGLGTINHTLLTLESLKSRGVNVMGILLVNKGDLVSNSAITENIEAIEYFSKIKVMGVLNDIYNFESINSNHYAFFSDYFL